MGEDDRIFYRIFQEWIGLDVKAFVASLLSNTISSGRGNTGGGLQRGFNYLQLDIEHNPDLIFL